jgi:hypothetical protein
VGHLLFVLGMAAGRLGSLGSLGRHTTWHACCAMSHVFWSGWRVVVFHLALVAPFGVQVVEREGLPVQGPL